MDGGLPFLQLFANIIHRRGIEDVRKPFLLKTFCEFFVPTPNFAIKMQGQSYIHDVVGVNVIGKYFGGTPCGQWNLLLRNKREALVDLKLRFLYLIEVETGYRLQSGIMVLDFFA